jgi:hypothetical protein
MSIPGAERYLNCVLHRGEEDILLVISVMLIAIVGIPGLILYQILPLYIESSVEFDLLSFYVYILFMSVLIAFFAYRMNASLLHHYERDLEWLSSLIEYAEGQGKETMALTALRDNMCGLVSRKLYKITLAIFLVLMVADTALAASYLYLNDYVLYYYEYAVIFAVFITLSGNALYVVDRIEKIDSIQCKFTQSFSECMSDEQPIIGSMPETVKPHRMWLHVVLIVVTLGIYSLILTIMAAHSLNAHIREQWAYEEDLLKWMMTKDGVDNIVHAEREAELSLLGQLYRII